MISQYEKCKCISYLTHHLIKNIHTERDRKHLQHWIDENCSNLWLSNFIKNKLITKDSDSVRNFAHKLSDICIKINQYKISPLDKNLNILGNILGLSTIEKEFIGFFIRYKKYASIENFFDFVIGYHSYAQPSNIALSLNINEEKILEILKPDGILNQFGILSENSYKYNLDLSPWIKNILNSNFKNQNEMIETIIGKPIKSIFSINDFNYIPQRLKIFTLLKNAVTFQEQGINILLYGKPGTGKTEFAKMLASYGNFKLYSIGEKTSEFHFDVSLDRYKQLMFANEALKTDSNTILLFDEAEDVFSQSIFKERTGVSKVARNRLLENNYRPTIWTSNDIASMDKAHLRRFSFIIHFETPPLEIRENIWKNAFYENHINCASILIKELAQSYNMPPAFISTAVRSLRLMNGTIDDLKMYLHEIELAKDNGFQPHKIGFL